MFSTRFVKQDEEGQVLHDGDFYIELEDNQKSTEINFEKKINRSELERQIQSQDTDYIGFETW